MSGMWTPFCLVVFPLSVARSGPYMARALFASSGVMGQLLINRWDRIFWKKRSEGLPSCWYNVRALSAPSISRRVKRVLFVATVFRRV